MFARLSLFIDINVILFKAIFIENKCIFIGSQNKDCRLSPDLARVEPIGARFGIPTLRGFTTRVLADLLVDGKKTTSLQAGASNAPLS